MRHLGRILCLLVGLICAQSAAAQEKLVAIVFDTSGSMRPRFELPSFGMQLLSATLDGRVGFDRLYSIDFGEYARLCDEDITIPSAATLGQMTCATDGLITAFNITDERTHSSALGQLAENYEPNSPYTPYGPLEVMLDRVSGDVQAGEEIILIVVSDGTYLETDDGTLMDGGLYRDQMRQSFETYRARILDRGGQISAQFVFIDQSGTAEPVVQDQGVRDTLLSVFNGDASDGAWHVTGRDALWDAMTNVIADVSGTDRVAQSSFISFSGNTISVNSPLSISRVVVASTGSVGRRGPVLQSNNFGDVSPTLVRDLDMQMPAGDSDFGNVRLTGDVRHLWFENPVPAGSYDLSFSGAVDPDEVFLLFETQSVTDLRIFEADSTEILPDASGQITLFTNTNYTFKSRILDGAGALVPVDLDTLPANLTMQLALDGVGIDDVRSMVLDRAADEGSVAFSTPQTGTFQAVSRASAGILSPQSPALTITVLEARTDLSVTPIRPVIDCPDCGSDEISSPVTGLDGPDILIGRFDVSANAAIDGAISFSDTSLPDGYIIRDAQGAIINLSEPIIFGASQTQTFELFRPASIDVADIDDGTEVSINVAPAGEWTGDTAQVGTRIKLQPADMGMTLVNVTQAVTPGTLDGLRVTSGELLRGQFSAFFSLTDLLVAPNPDEIEDLVTIQSSGFIGGLLNFNSSFGDPRATGFHSIDARPTTSYWCLCFLGISNAIRGSDIRDYTVQYAVTVDGVVLQQASAPLAVQTPIQRSQFGLSCLLDAFLLLLFVMFIRGIFALIFTHRFPKGSVMEIVEGRSVPRFKRLDKGNSVWWKAWFALFTGNPDEVRVVEGLKIQATSRGAVVDIAKSAPPWNVERLGESFAELKESRTKTMKHKLIWGDRMENTLRPTLSMILKKRSSE